MEQKIQFGIDSFKVRSFSFTDTDETLRKDRINFNISLKVKFNPDSHKFHVLLKIGGVHGKQNPIELGTIETESIFRITSTLEKNEKGELSLPDIIIISLISIAYSTTRGAMTVKAQSTILADSPLPIIDPKSLWEHFKERYLKK